MIYNSDGMLFSRENIAPLCELLYRFVTALPNQWSVSREGGKGSSRFEAMGGVVDLSIVNTVYTPLGHEML